MHLIASFWVLLVLLPVVLPNDFQQAEQTLQQWLHNTAIQQQEQGTFPPYVST
jgi:hypothetical protein